MESPVLQQAWWPGNRSKRLPGHLPERFGALGLAIALGVLLSLGWYFVIRGWERRSSRAEAHNLASERTELLRVKLLGSMEALDALAALHATWPHELSRLEFHEFAHDALARHPEIQALSWNPIVTLAQRDQREAAARADGLSGFEFREIDSRGAVAPATQRASYVPVYFEEPIAGNEPSLGFDLASSPQRKESLDRARDSGEPEATAPLRLIQERGDQLGFLIVRPLYRGPSQTLAQRRANLTGFVSAVFRIGDLVELALGNVDSHRMDISIYDELNGNALIDFRPAAASKARPMGSPQPPAIIPGAPEFAETLGFPGGRWRIVFRPAPGYTPEHERSWQSLAGLATGLLITLLAAGYIWRGKQRTEEIERCVEARTSELSNEITERRRVEDALRQAEAKYRSIFENSIEGIFQTTTDGHYLSANPALARLYGYGSPAELIADLADIDRRLYVEPSRRAEFTRLVRESGSVSDFESQVRRKDGSVIWISEKARAVRGPDGGILYYEGVVDDITGRKHADETLRTSRDALESRVAERTAELAQANEALRAEVAERQRAESAAASANAAKSAFLAHMSHEIRTPLNAILGYAQILRRDSTLRAAHRPAIDTIANSGNHLLGLIDDVLDLSKIEAGRMELQLAAFDLRQLLSRLETMFAHQCQLKRLALAVETPEWLPANVEGDEGKLRQTLINLLGNALKFTSAGQVRLGVTEIDRDLYRFEVSDTGIGIPAEAQAAIFEPFHQGAGGYRNGGTGLGLPIARRQVELMGGTLELKSAPGEGSCFFFEIRLPAVRDAAVRLPALDARRRPGSGSAVRALVVDDIEANREVLAAMLAEAGCECLMAADASQALEQARSANPHIVFMDIWLPGANGIEAARRIHSECGEGIRLVAHSASAFDEDRARCLEAGFDDFLVKPFRFERVRETLDRLLEIDFVSPMPGAESRSRDAGEGSCPAASSVLPAPLLERLHLAAELHSITDLAACAREIACLGLDGERLARELDRRLEGCDIQAIQEMLGERIAACGFVPADLL